MQIRSRKPVPLLLLSIFLAVSCAADVEDASVEAKDRVAGAVDPALTELHREFESFIRAGGEVEAFESQRAGLRIRNGEIVIEATASTTGLELAEELESLGATSIAHYDRLVSCRIPIASIPRLSGLSALRYARPAYEIVQ